MTISSAIGAARPIAAHVGRIPTMVVAPPMRTSVTRNAFTPDQVADAAENQRAEWPTTNPTANVDRHAMSERVVTAG